MTTAIYETFARMSQPFTNNVPEVDFHGANGNVILGGSAISADRYSEARLSRMAEDYMLNGCEKDSVDMQLNFSEDEWWPTVLPSVFPRLLVNGSQGIGVSIANSWCLHGLTETAEVLENYIKTGDVDNESYLPDWPCGATIVNKSELAAINETGKGKIVTEAKYEVKGREIRFTEFPFQVYIEPLVEEIKSAIEADKIHNVSEVFNKSDKTQILLTVTCTSAAKVPQVLEELMSNTSLRSQFNVNQVAIVGKTPKLLTLADMCEIYVTHNLSCIKREHQFDLDKTLARIEVLEGLTKALGDIDGLINLIKTSESGAQARERLESYNFTTPQIDAILSMRLSRLAHLEVNQILQELAEKKELAKSLRNVVESEGEQKKVLVSRLKALVKEFGDSRRTKVVQKEIKKASAAKAKKEPERVMFCLDSLGYAKTVLLSRFKSVESNVREVDVMENECMTLISNRANAFNLKPQTIKKCLNSEKGTALGSVLETQSGETIIGMEDAANSNLAEYFIATKLGRVKRVKASAFDRKTQCKHASPMIKMAEDDSVVFCEPIGAQTHVRITTTKGILTFPLNQVGCSGKASSGKAGVKLDKGEFVREVALVDSPQDSIGNCGNKVKKS